MTDAREAFIEFMREHGVGPENPADIIGDDKRRRYRLAGDKPRTSNASYSLSIEADGFAFGWARSFKEGVTHKWHTKAARKLSKEDRAAHKARADAAKKARADEDARLAADAAAKAQRMWKRGKTASTPYLERKQVDLHGAKVWRDLVMVPMWRDAKIVGLQFISPDGSKRFSKDADIKGAYHAMASKSDDLSRLVICEGFATGGTIRQATGWPVVVAYNAGNLKPVAQAMRRKYPDAEIIIGADDDQWSTNAKGEPYNSGMEHARQAAVAIGGARVIAPVVDPEDPDRPTDWNDIAVRDGLQVVTDAFTSAPPPLIDDGLDYDNDPGMPMPDEQPGALDAVRPLGRNGKLFYFFPRAAGQIMDFTGPSLANVQNLVTMAPMSLWFSYFGGPDVSEKKMAGQAANALIEECNRIGIYNPEAERGVGMWMDATGPVLNTGQLVHHTAGSCRPPDFRAKSVYVMGPPAGRLSDEALGNKDASELLSVCLSLSWKHKQAGYVLAGWIVAAICGGALRWRPHIVVTGEKGAGKTWVVEHVVKPALGGLALERDGGSTESKIRTDLSGTSRPLIMDEAESESGRARATMESVFQLARKASTGAAIGNANGIFYIRSCFCFSAINPRIVHGADLDRNTILHLVKDRRHDATKHFQELERRVLELITPDYSASLVARCFKHLPVIMANVEVFSRAIANIEGSKRFGDQFGALIACAFSLTSGKEVTAEFAEDWCRKNDWQWAREDNDQSDGERLLDCILSRRIRYDDRGMVREASVGSLIDRTIRGEYSDREAAAEALGAYAVQVRDDRLLIGGPCPQMSDLLRDTAWSGNYKRALGELTGATTEDKVRFTATLRRRAVSIPLSHVIADMQNDASNDVELPFDMEGF